MRCAIATCKSDNQAKAFSKTIKFFRFPSNPELCKVWVNICKRREQFNVGNARVCSLHFPESAYTRNMKYELLGYRLEDYPSNCRVLNEDVVPTLRLPILEVGKIGSPAQPIRYLKRSNGGMDRSIHQEDSPGGVSQNIAKKSEGTSTVIFQSACRCCLCDCKDGVSFKIHSSLILKNIVADIVSKCAYMQIKQEDSLPKQLCQRCFEELSNCYMFIDKYQKSEQTLNAILNRKETAAKQEIKQEEIVVSDLESEISEQNEQSCSFPEQLKSKSNLDSLTPIPQTYIHNNGLYLKPTLWRNALKKRGVSEESFVQSRHLISKEEKPYFCDVCNKSFSHRSALRRHLKLYSHQKHYKCNDCERSFAQKGQLVVHERTHTEEKPYSCDICNNSFSKKSTLMRHLEIHSQDKRYKCDVCERSFTQKVQLVVHEKTHTAEKPFSCDICNSKFYKKSVLMRHLETHSQDKRYKCDVCERSFAQKGQLVVHERTHTGEKPYSCYTCGSSFCKKSSLLRHSETHSQDKRYKCDVCEKSYTQKIWLVVHKRKHTGEKPYSCDACNESFSTRYALKRHLLKHSIHVKDELT